MGSADVPEKTAEELRKEIEELKRQQWEISERLRDPRGIRRAGLGSNGPRPNLNRHRGVVRPAERGLDEDQPAPKRRLSSAVVKVGGGEEDEMNAVREKVGMEGDDLAAETRPEGGTENSYKFAVGSQRDGGARGARRSSRINYDVPSADPSPRVLPKNEDPSLVKRNRRMLGQLLGTLEKFREEDKQLSSTEAYMRRSDSLKRAEQRAREESEKLRQQEREQIVEKRKRDLTLRARVAAKQEEKKLELLFIQWSDHQKKLCNFIRTKAEPSIYYLPKMPVDEDPAVNEKEKEQIFLEWKSARRAELSEYQKQIEEQYLSNVQSQLERWQNARNARKANKMVNLQESMDKDLETHQLEHGPKTRRIPGTEEEEDVEDIAAEDDIMDDVLGIDENVRADGDAGDAPAPHAGDLEGGDGTKPPPIE